MVYSTIIDPELIDNNSFIENQLSFENVRDIFKDIIRKNLLLIVDEELILVNKYVKNIVDLKTQFRQHLNIFIEELFKNGCRNQYSKVLKSPIVLNSNDKLNEFVTFCKNSNPDSIVSNNFQDRKINNIILLDEYKDSTFRKEMEEDYDSLPPLDSLPKDKAEEVIKRILKFTKRIDIYDKQIGRGGNLTKFLVMSIYLCKNKKVSLQKFLFLKLKK